MIAEGLLAALPTRAALPEVEAFDPEEILCPSRRRFGRSGGNAGLCGYERPGQTLRG